MFDLHATERPREKLLARGAAALSDGELIAILLRTGTAGASVLDLAQTLVRRVDGHLIRFADLTLAELCSVRGIGPDKAATLVAAFELGKRFVEDLSHLDDAPVTHARTVYRLMLPRLKGLSHEECWVLFLNASSQLVATRRLSSGGTTETVVDNRMVLAEALEHRARGLILVHNHPNLNPLPSTADIEVTRRLREAARSLDLQLLDHVIISGNGFYSFADEKVYRP